MKFKTDPVIIDALRRLRNTPRPAINAKAVLTGKDDAGMDALAKAWEDAAAAAGVDIFGEPLK
jgi:hypothetical protein